MCMALTKEIITGVFEALLSLRRLPHMGKSVLWSQMW